MVFDAQLVNTCLIITIIIVSINIGMLIKDISYRHERIQNKMLISELESRLKSYSVLDTSEMIRNIIIQVVTDIAIMDFREFKDSHDIQKVTRAKIRDLVKKVAIDSREMFDVEKLEEYDSILGEGSCDKYIVYMASTLVKNILEKEVINIIEEEG